MATCFWFLSFFWWRCAWIWTFALFSPYPIAAHILWRAPALFQNTPSYHWKEANQDRTDQKSFEEQGLRSPCLAPSCCCCCCWQKDMRLKTGKTWQDQSCYEPYQVLARTDVHVWKPAVYRNEMQWNISTRFNRWPVASKPLLHWPTFSQWRGLRSRDFCSRCSGLQFHRWFIHSRAFGG